MDDTKALAIVSALANGVNPMTGEPFAADSPYQAPDIIRALYHAIRLLDAGRERLSRTRGPQHVNAGKPWNEQEDHELLAQFDRGCEIAELARAHGRTLAGIRLRLERHGRVPPGSPGESLYARRTRAALAGGAVRPAVTASMAPPPSASAGDSVPG